MITYQNKVSKSTWTAWVLLSIMLIVTIYASVSVVINIEAEAKREFEFASSQIELRIGARMDAHKQILISAAALFDTSDEITREQWRNFVLQQKVEQYLPGIDDITNRLVALGILKKLGLRADAVFNGEEALIALQSERYDLVLMDVNMPVMNGFEATKRIRNYELGITNKAQTDDSSSSFVIHHS